jgi:membrane-bound ClpP family serine protease
MEFIFEIIVGLILDGSIEISKSSKVPKYIRYPLIAIILLFSIAVIGLIFLVGILSFKENIVLGLIMILLGMYASIIGIVKFRKIDLIKRTVR